MPHFHLSLQSGCDETLKRMNRRYNSEEYYEKCTLLRKYFQDPALTTDVIVGFPGETEEEFEASRELWSEYVFMRHILFKYSRREGTRAAVMKDQVPEQIKAKRSAVLIGLGHEKQNEYERKYTGEKWKFHRRDRGNRWKRSLDRTHERIYQSGGFLGREPAEPDRKRHGRQGFTNYSLNFKSLYIRIKCSDFIEIDARNERKTEGKA